MPTIKTTDYDIDEERTNININTEDKEKLTDIYVKPLADFDEAEISSEPNLPVTKN
jgi:hypothetical protein